jgi:photosystem II stability/assembly factor-like uncharacterized protein
MIAALIPKRPEPTPRGRFPVMRRARLPLVLCLLGLAALLVFPQPALAQKGKKGAEKEAEEEKEEDVMSAGTFAGLSFRAIGPGIASGRISDVVVHPTEKATWYVTVASGGVWKTTDGAVSWQPIFDGEGSYSIGCIAIDPNDPLTLWVGTGENNSQRSVGYGDGVYRSRDGGTSWEHVGLEESEHIGKIVVDPRDSNRVFVAAQGPLWSAGGDRGLYKTADGGESWEKVLEISEHTGVTDLVYDPRNPDVMYAAAYQRRRHTWTLINGGPESAIYKTTDGGANWREVENGLPKVELGRIGLAIAPTRPDTVYAIVEAADDESGFYRSTDRGENWKKMNDYVASSPQYYMEIVVDPVDPDRVYSLDTFSRVSDDGGATWRRLGSNARHVDDHGLWIDPENTAHLLIGGDGGLYESFNGGETWRFFDNLPITQFYKIAVDQDQPFYNVYGGTQDNNTLGGPTRTISGHGIMNREWFVTVSGDGFEPAVDPTNPDIIYSQWQYGGLVRYDKKSGEIVDVQPQPEPGDPPPRWNWSSALLLSPHSPTRLYYGSQRLWKSDDRGDTWQPISGDLTRDLDRNELEVMGRVWSVDSVAKNNSTSYYGTIVALAESPLAEGLLYTGSDDGLVHVSADDGASWRRIDGVPGVPEQSYVSFLMAAVDDADTVYAAFDNHKQGDFKPYVVKSTDRGETWGSIAGDLPERGTVYSLAQDGEDPDLLFAGTEFGVWFSLDGGGHWIELSGGVPTIAVYDLEVQRREDDLVLGTFGRGFYVLDDYSPLRGLTREQLDGDEAILFAPRDARLYVESTELGFPGKGFQGDAHYAAPNPPFGAVFTWYVKEAPKSLADQRHELEKEALEAGQGNPYPSWDELRAEDREEDPKLVFTVRDADGRVVRRLTTDPGTGMQRIAWDLRYPALDPTDLSPPAMRAPWETPPVGPLATPGTYTVELAQRVRGETTELAGPRSFEVVPLNLATLGAADKGAVLAFQQQTARLQRAALGAAEVVGETQSRLDHLAAAWAATPAAAIELRDRVSALDDRLADLRTELFGDRTVGSRSEPTSPGILDRVLRSVYGGWTVTAAPTTTHRRGYEIAAEEFEGWLARLRTLVDRDLAALEDEMEAAGAPWTPGRVPTWQPE